MGILSRFKEIMSSNVHALLDKAEDPSKQVDDYMRKVQRDLAQLKAETASVITAKQRAKRALDECMSEINKLERYAEKSVQSGNDAGAMRFLDMKASLTEKLPQLEAAYEAAVSDAERMQQLQDKLQQDVRALEERHLQLQDKLQTVKRQQQTARGKDLSRGDFDAAAEKIDMAYDEAMALAELRSDSADDLDEAFAQLERKRQQSEGQASDSASAVSSTQQELDAIKKRLGKR